MTGMTHIMEISEGPVLQKRVQKEDLGLEISPTRYVDVKDEEKNP
jgi:hypothetical protein